MKFIIEEIERYIKGRVLYDEPMKRHTSFRIGGPADVWVEPKEIEDLRSCVQIRKQKNIPLFIVGNGTNILVRDVGIRGIVLNMLSTSLKRIYISDNKITASSSVTIKEFLNFCCDNELRGMEFLSGIPGTIGGALLTNAGARHYEMTEKWFSVGDFVEEVVIMNYAAEIVILHRERLSFGYKSLNLTDCVVLEAKFMLAKAKRRDILSECKRFLKRKLQTQELNTPSAGCIFKNPLEFNKSAGELIDRCNLKGMRIGGAEISKRHANFIINTGNASSNDVLRLIDVIRDRVREGFGIELSLEIKIV